MHILDIFSGKKYLMLFVLLFYFPCISAKKPTAKIDSLLYLIDQSYIKGNVSQNKILEYTKNLYDTSKKNNYIHGQTLAVFEEARILYLKADFQGSIKKVNQGLYLAKLENDYNLICRFLLLYQSSLLRLNYFSEAKQVLAKCIEYNNSYNHKENKKTINVYILLAQAELLVDQNGLSSNMSKVIELKNRAYSESFQLDNSNKYKKMTLLYSLTSLAWSVTLSGNLQEARKYTAEIDKLLSNYPNENSIMQSLILKGIIENTAGNYNDAANYFLKAITLAKNENNLYRLSEIYPMISISYTKLNDFKNATKYSLEFKKISDSLDLTKQKLDNTTLVDNISEKTISTKSSTLKNLSLVIGTLLILLVALYFYKISKIKSNKLEKNADTKEEVSIKEPYTISSSNDNLEVADRLIDLAKTNINLFYIEFHKIYPTFHQSLQERYNDLNLGDLNFCALVKMNFGSKEIAAYSKSSVRAIDSRRFRIIKKMQIKNQDELYLIISKIN